MTEHKCCALVYLAPTNKPPCNRPAHIQRGEKWFCKKHDPAKARTRAAPATASIRGQLAAANLQLASLRAEIEQLRSGAEVTHTGSQIPRAIIYIDSIHVNVDHDDAKPLDDGWEIHVRNIKQNVDIIHVAKTSDGKWDMRCEGESWGRFTSIGDVFMQALDPISGVTE